MNAGIRACPALWITALVMACTYLVAVKGHAQTCGEQWLPGLGMPGTNGTVHASTVWDPDGSGPDDPLVVMGGEFTNAGGLVVSRIVAWNPASQEWIGLGEGFNGTVLALAALPNGDLFAGGEFTHSGVTAVNHIARWDSGSVAWSAIGSGANNIVYSMAALAGGELAIGGDFTSLNGSSFSRIARWNGVAWASFGAGVNGRVSALAALPSGGVVAGGLFTFAGSGMATRIARWDGADWAPLGSGLNGQARIIAIMADGDFAVGGDFTQAGGASAPKIARWNPTTSTWSTFGSGAGSWVAALAVLSNGDLIAGGAFDRIGSGPWRERIARWDGTTWVPLERGFLGPVRTLCTIPTGEVFVGGEMFSAPTPSGSIPVRRVALWDGLSWAPVGKGIDNLVAAILPTSDGGMIIGGGFHWVGGQKLLNVARWNGSNWSAMGLGIRGTVRALAGMSDGRVVAAGDILSADGVDAQSIAVWNGASWAELGGGVNGGIDAMHMRNDTLIIGGAFDYAGEVLANNIALWDGSAWHALGSGFDDYVMAVTYLPNGDIVAGGYFDYSGPIRLRHVARWDGTTWNAMGGGPADSSSGGVVLALLAMPNGDVIAGGDFTHAGEGLASYVARWDGVEWQGMGTGLNAPVRALALSENGDIIAGGDFTVGTSPVTKGVARWNGTAWEPLGDGLASGAPSLYVSALAAHGGDKLLMGGRFETAGGLPSSSLAQWTDTNSPWVVTSPLGQFSPEGDTLMLTAAPAPGYENLYVQWFRDGEPIMDGPGGASFGGGNVSGSSGPVPTPSDGSFATLAISDARVSDSGSYAAVFSNACGDAATTSAVIVVVPSCIANYNGAGDEGDIVDFLDFMDDFGTCVGGPGPCGEYGNADVNSDTVVDVLDFLDFMDSFGQGC